MTKKQTYEELEKKVKELAQEASEFKQVEKALRNSKELFEKTFVSQKDAIFILDAEVPPKILDCNPAAARLFGYSRQEMLGRTTEFLHVDEGTLQEFRKQLYPTITKQKFFYLNEFKMKRQDETVFQSEHTVVPLKDENGERTGWVSVVRDISERKRSEEEIRRSYRIQTVLNQLLSVTLEDISLQNMLEKFIYQITSIPWLALQSKGAIFLVGNDPEMLRMVANRELSPANLSMCFHVPLGRCLCGRAALSRQIEFADGVDERHENQYEGSSPHGHYCVPIISRGKKVIGVINLYLREGHLRDQREEEFLTAIANTLAGIIELKQSELALKNREKELETRSFQLNEANIALRVLLKRREEDKTELEEKVLSNIKDLIHPSLNKLKKSKLDEKQRDYLEILESNINEIILPFSRKLSSKYFNLTPTEIQIADLVKGGRTSKEIAELMNLSSKTVEFHRDNIREKLGLKKRKVNLKSYLLSLQ